MPPITKLKPIRRDWVPPTIGNGSRPGEWLLLTCYNASRPCERLPLRGGMYSRLCEWLPLSSGIGSRLCEGLPLCSDRLGPKFDFFANENILLIYIIFNNFGHTKTTYLTTSFPVAFWVALLSVYT